MNNRPLSARSSCRPLLLVAGLAIALGGCPSESDPPGNATGGSGGSATGGRGGSTGGSGGSAGGTGGSAATGGSGGSGGSGGAGGGRAPDGRLPDGRRPDGPTADGRRPDTGATADTGGSAAVGSRPSPGCGKANPPQGTRTIGGQSVSVGLPPDYDANKAYPVAFGFHGFGRTNQHCLEGDCGGFRAAMQGRAVLVYIKSVGAGWETDTREQNLTLFNTVFAAVKNDYCVDENRVLAAGTSSGASFVNILACRLGNQLRVVSPVAGTLANNERANCKAPPALVMVHGVRDGSFGGGQQARNFFAEKSGCAGSTVPPLADMHGRLMAASAARRETIECVDYVGCTSAPLKWCEHSYGGYDGSTHGWPPAASPMIFDFLLAQP
jgi:polyhydroxybutyrate depolymerase